jgi:hypothetical protein
MITRLSRMSARLSKGLLGFFIGTAGFAQQSRESMLTDLVLQLNTNKSTYIPGELVDLRFRLTPRSSTALAPARISVFDGSLRVLVSHASGDYCEYKGPGWGIKRTFIRGVVTLSVGQAVESTATMLYNRVPDTRHLTAVYRAQRMAGRLPHEYAFSESGTFQVKAYRSQWSGQQIESDPVTVFVSEPAGDDFEVWQVLQSHPKLGYL